MTAPAQYRHKPGVVTAVRIPTDEETEADGGRALEEALEWVYDDAVLTLLPSYYTLKTLHGIAIVHPGDWILKGEAGDYWPCKPDIFEAFYEPAEAKYPARNPVIAAAMAPVRTETRRGDGE